MTQQQTGQNKAAQLRAVLVAQDVRSIRGSLGRFLLGLGWCLLAVFIWATLFTLLFDALFGGSGIGWRGWFVVGVLALAGLIFWLERRVIMAEAAGTPGAPTGPSGDYALPAGPGGWLPRLVWGPPAMLAGFRGLRGKRTRHQEAVLDRAAVLVLDLNHEPGSVPAKAVLHPPEDMNVFGAAVDWLEANDWIGQSTDRTLLFISTLGKKRLVERGLTA
jgi:hypothetical protein